MKKILSIILSITMLFSMTAVAFANNPENEDDSKTELYTFEELTNISSEDVAEIAINYNNGERISVTTEDSSVIAEIVDSFKDIQFWRDDTEGGGAGGWLYFINFYFEDGSYIQYGTSLHIDKVTYKALNYEESTEKMAYYYDLLSNKDGVDGPMQKAKIIVGTSADFPPFEYYGESGELIGFDIDLMKYIGEKIGFDIEFVNMSFDKLIPAVVSGEVDCAISAITVTEERDSVIDYSRDYLKTYNITFDENGKRSKKYGEQYAIVFREGLSHSPYEDLTKPTRDETLYILIDKALRELSNDRTVMKLIEQYELNKPLDESIVNVEYSAIMGDGDPAAKTDKEPITSATSIGASEWAWADIDKAHALNITNYGGNYDFSGAITREQFCALIYNYVAEFGELPADSGHIVFIDTDNTKIRVLNTLGIIKGKTETQFAPNDLLTREEAATILNRLINVVHPGLANTELYFEFADGTQISDWAMNDIQRICNMGIMKGVGNNNFAPQDNYTTEQAIVTLVRVYANSGVSKNDKIDTEDEVEFYNINSNDNTRGEKIEKQEDGWYKLQSVAGSFISYDGEEPKSVTAYFTPAGTDTEQYEKQVGFNEMLKTQNPVSVKLTFEEEDTLGHLHFVFEYEIILLGK